MAAAEQEQSRERDDIHSENSAQACGRAGSPKPTATRPHPQPHPPARPNSPRRFRLNKKERRKRSHEKSLLSMAYAAAPRQVGARHWLPSSRAAAASLQARTGRRNNPFDFLAPAAASAPSPDFLRPFSSPLPYFSTRSVKKATCRSSTSSSNNFSILRNMCSIDWLTAKCAVASSTPRSTGEISAFELLLTTLVKPTHANNTVYVVLCPSLIAQAEQGKRKQS